MSSVDTSIGQGGTFAQGPASPVQPPGMGITTVPTFLAPSTTVSAAFKSGTVVALASFPPLGPIDGQQVILELPSTYDPVGGKTIRWAFAYNGSDAVWDFIGGPPLYAEITTAENTASATYVDLATSGPSQTIPRAGDYIIEAQCVAAQTVSAATIENPFMSYSLGGTGAADADAATGVLTSANNPAIYIAATREKTGLTTSETVVAKYKDTNTKGVTFSNRRLRITPVRIT